MWYVLGKDASTEHTWQPFEVVDSRYEANRYAMKYVLGADGRDVIVVFRDDLHLYLKD